MPVAYTLQRVTGGQLPFDPCTSHPTVLHIAESLSSEPECDGGDREHRQVVGGSLFVACRDTAKLLEAVDEPFDPIPFSVKPSVK